LSNSFRNQDLVPFWRVRSFVLSVVVFLFSTSDSIRVKIIHVAEHLAWFKWVRENYSARYFFSREALWRRIHRYISEQNSWAVFEFGVAWGYATNYWLTRVGDNVAEWHGFDSFVGLPRPWRHLPEGAFDASGFPPAIQDPRVTWHIGSVEEQLPKMRILSGPKIILFDLDIYEPTIFAWNLLSPILSQGDIVYFDEAFDQDERRVVIEGVCMDFDLSVIGFTHSSIAFQLGSRIKEIKDFRI
jgi:hypothetical protein